MSNQFNPPDGHWCADFDSRLRGSLEYLKERLDADESTHNKQLAEMRALHADMQQMVKDCKFLLDESRQATPDEAGN